MKSIFNLAIILPLAVFSVGMIGCSAPEAPAEPMAPKVSADGDAAAEPAASDKKEEGGSGSH